MRRNRGLERFAIAVGALSAALLAAAAHAQPYTTWRTYGGGGAFVAVLRADQINKSNVAQLEVAWTLPGRRTQLHLQPDRRRRRDVRARTRQRRSSRSTRQPARSSGRIRTKGPVGARGINYWESADGSDRRLLYLNAGILDGDQRAHRRDRSRRFGDNGRVDLRVALAADGWDITNVRRCSTSNPGRIFENLMIVSLPAQGAGYAVDAGRRAGLRRRDRQARAGCSTAFRTKASSATTPGRRALQDGRRRAQLERAHGRRGERHRVHPVRHGALRLLRRRPRGQQPVRQLARRARRAHRQAALAPAARAPRPVGLRPAAGAEAADDPPDGRARATSSRRPPSTGSCSCSIARPASRSGRSRSGRCRSPTCRASRRRRRSRSRRSRRRSRASRSPRRTSTRTCPRAEQEILRQKLRNVAQRRAVHAAELRRARSAMPGHNGGANWASSAVDPRQRRALRRVEEPARDAARRAHRRGADGAQRERPRRHARASRAARSRRRRPRPRSGPVRYAVPYDFLRSPANGMAAIGPPWSEHHGVRPEHRRDQVARAATAARTGPEIPDDVGRALPARRAARDGGRAGVRRDGSGPRGCAPTIATTARCCGRTSCRAARKAFRRRTSSAAGSISRCRSRPARGCSRRSSRRPRRRSIAPTSCSRCRRRAEANPRDTERRAARERTKRFAYSPGPTHSQRRRALVRSHAYPVTASRISRRRSAQLHARTTTGRCGSTELYAGPQFA